MNGFTKLLILSILVDSSLFASLNITEARNVSDDDKEGNSKETDENGNREARTNKGNFDIEKILSKISGPMVKNLFDPYNEDRKSTASANVGDDNSDREARISFGRVNFDIEDILSKISGPIVQNLFNPRPHPMRRAYSEERVINRLIKKRKEKIKNHKRFQDDILSILALKRERNEEDIPSKYSPTSPKDDYNNLIIPEPPKGNWPVKITYQNKDSKHETLKKLFDIAGIDMNKSHEEHENNIDDKHQLLKHKQYYPSPMPELSKDQDNSVHEDVHSVEHHQGVSKLSCPEPDGYFPVPGSCDSYVHCSHGVSAIISCGDHLGWNRRTLSCDWKSNLKC